MRRPTVAHARHNYLPISEVFIYQQLIHLQNYVPIFLSETVENTDLFPLKRLYVLSRLARWSPRRVWNALAFRLLRRRTYFEHIIRKKKAVLIHAHFGNEGVRMLPIKRRLNIPLITAFYGYDAFRLPRQTGWLLAYKELFRDGDIFLVEGNHMARRLYELGCPVEKVRIWHLGVNLSEFNSLERVWAPGKERIRILFCGRLVEKKGIMYALQAVQHVARGFPDIEFRIIGDGPLRAEVQQYIAKHSMQSYVTLLGYQPHIVYAKELRNSHILLQPSVVARDGDCEGGAPVVLLEAQASGVPVISTLHCDIPEYVIDGVSGFLVPERNVDSLVERLEYLIMHPQLWAQMGKAGREHVEKDYEIRTQVRKLEDIYRQLEGNPGNR